MKPGSCCLGTKEELLKPDILTTQIWDCRIVDLLVDFITFVCV